MSKAKKVYFIISGIFSLLVVTTLVTETLFFTKLLDLQAITSEQIYYSEKLAEKEYILRLLEERYGIIENDIDIIMETLPEDKDASRLIADLNSIATKSSLKFTNVESRTADTKSSSKKSTALTDPSLLQTVKGSYGYEMPLSIKVEGSYSNLVSFIESVEGYQRLVNIVYIQIDRVEHETINDYVEVSLDITAYLKK